MRFVELIAGNCIPAFAYTYAGISSEIPAYLQPIVQLPNVRNLQRYIGRVTEEFDDSYGCEFWEIPSGVALLGSLSKNDADTILETPLQLHAQIELWTWETPAGKERVYVRHRRHDHDEERAIIRVNQGRGNRP